MQVHGHVLWPVPRKCNLSIAKHYTTSFGQLGFVGALVSRGYDVLDAAILACRNDAICHPIKHERVLALKGHGAKSRP